ncbi:transglycosylase SLT domain-containing protein [candidate division KSB1 bacterium]|nr:transglycosylase SLT domain-containing protein [candidate division KSB1 bacterium]
MYKILIADDDPRISQLFERVLTKEGYHAIVCHSVEDGIKLALKEHPDIILSDYVMHDQNGEQFCAAVRSYEEISSTPFIIITGRGTNEIRTEGLSILFDDYLDKPIDLSFLIAKINATIRRKEEESKRSQKIKNKLKFTRLGLIGASVFLCLVTLGFTLHSNSQQKQLSKLQLEKTKYDERVLAIQSQLDSLGCKMSDLDFDRINTDLRTIILNAKIINTAIPKEAERDVIIRGIKEIMANFGEKDYNVPPLFASEVYKMVEQFIGPRKYSTQRTLKRAQIYLPMITKIFQEKGLPEELAYIAMVESAFNPNAVNATSGATGLWQFMVGTAREYGLRVDRFLDERKHPLKSTLTASEYLLDLIAVFGKKSALLAIASYNVGDGAVRFQLKKLSNPLEERDFWYLFDQKALPQETREYIPRVIASIIVHRYAEQLGIELEEPGELAQSYE